jgi:hypothetical protein
VKKQPLSAHDHALLGADLKKARELLMNAYVKYGNAYPVKDSVPCDLERILNRLDKVRSDAEDHLFREHPGEATTQHYYGPELPPSLASGVPV